jgi:protein disulfide-isomerase
MRYHWSPLFLVFATLLALPARAQQNSIQWHHDLESAKTAAKQTNRLVLIHFWTTSCGPCLALDQKVFNQPGVASAIEAQFVPVKLNADENSATAQWYEINRVPMDVVITPDGQLIGKHISPPTPMAYVSEAAGLASKHMAKTGGAFAVAATAAPVQPQINAAYAGLNVGPNTPPALSAAVNPPSKSPNSPPSFGMGGLTSRTSNPPANSLFASSAPPPLGPQSTTNPAAMNSTAYSGQPPITPVGQPQFSAPPAQVANPYFAGPTPPPPQQPLAPQFGAPNTSATPPLAATAAAPMNPIVPAGVPDPSKLPPGSPPLGFDGYCPVSMRNTWKWIPGDPKWGIIHDGRTYWFAGPNEQQQFWKDPARYAPALAGNDPVLAIDHKQNVPGKREHSLDFDGLFYMFASEATLQQFSANPHRYAASVRQVMGIPRGRLVR